MSRASSSVFIAVTGCFLLGGASAPGCAQTSAKASPPADSIVQLPKAQVTGKVPLEDAIARRRSVRQYAAAPLTLAEVGQIAWAAQGITGEGGKRAAPSARAKYPVELYLVASSVGGLAPGVYHYVPAQHALARVTGGDARAFTAAGQPSIASAPLTLVFTGVASRLSSRPDPVSDRWIGIEIGAAAQNVYLQATALGLGTVIVGGIQPGEVAKALQLNGAGAPVPFIAMPVGRAR